jgi:Uma2 family endonuclease
MNGAAPRPLVSEAEFLRLPESTAKIELLDGEVVMSPSPTYWHQELVGRLLVALRSWANTQRRTVTIGHAPLDVRFAPGRILQPDIFVLFGSIPRRQRGPLMQIPELCIEVLSDDRVHDRVTKRLVYAGAGVKEYWIVEPAGLVERWTGEGFEHAQRSSTKLSTPLLPGFELDLRRLFATK